MEPNPEILVRGERTPFKSRSTGPLILDLWHLLYEFLLRIVAGIGRWQADARSNKGGRDRW